MIELLTVMAVIAILIGLLVPALTLVRDFAKEIQQRSQFHAIDVGLELYKTELDTTVYPPSNENNLDLTHPVLGDDAGYYGGANKLAEAIVGLDSLGLHSSSRFRADGQSVRDDPTGPGQTPPAVLAGAQVR